MIFDFEVSAIKPDELNIDKTEFLIEDFLVKEAITMIYGAASQGKTWFMYALSKYLVSNTTVKKLFYIDMDNGKRQLKDRGVDKNLLIFDKVKYLIKSSINLSPYELIVKINSQAYSKNYEDIVFIFDSTRDFVDTKNDKQAKSFMEKMKNIREAGGTILLIHHASKSGKVIDGSVEFPRSADNVYELKQKNKSPQKIHYALKVENDRDPIKDMAFSVEIDSFNLAIEDDALVNLSAQEEQFVVKVLDIIKETPLNQVTILKNLGKSRDDKTAKKLLAKFVNLYWDYDKKGKQKLYYPKGVKL
jgi:archaellum biogenesis ATPase FlaH